MTHSAFVPLKVLDFLFDKDSDSMNVFSAEPSVFVVSMCQNDSSSRRENEREI